MWKDGMLNINRCTEHTRLLSAYQKRWDPKPNNVTVYSVEEHLESLSVMNPHQLPYYPNCDSITPGRNGRERKSYM